MRTTRRAIVLGLAVAAFVTAQAQQQTIDQFFSSFSDEWMRGNPNGATQSRYFSGEEQDRMERQLTPLSAEYRRERVRLAQRGLAELKKFDRSRLTETQRVSAELMDWQLDTLVRGEAFEDYSFPLEQFGGANVGLVNTLTVSHPLRTEKDA